MDRCWASSISECDGKLSREHLISKSLFLTNVITVKGYPWCKDEEITIGLPNLTSKVLCQKHNKLLSEVDKLGATAFSILRDISKLSNIRSKIKPRRWNIKRNRINGFILERWFLKTLINISYSGKDAIGINNNDSSYVPIELIEICYGLKQFTEKEGLYVAGFKGQEIFSHDSVHFAPLMKDDKFVIGGLFSFRGYNFMLSLIDNSLPINLMRQISGLPNDWSESEIHHHMKLFNIKIGKHTSEIVEFKW
jgi:hypothetical protein